MESPTHKKNRRQRRRKLLLSNQKSCRAHDVLELIPMNDADWANFSDFDREVYLLFKEAHPKQISCEEIWEKQKAVYGAQLKIVIVWNSVDDPKMRKYITRVDKRMYALNCRIKRIMNLSYTAFRFWYSRCTRQQAAECLAKHQVVSPRNTKRRL